MVKAARFELRLVQLWVRNLTNSANSFQETHRHIKCTLKLPPRLPRWPPYCKMADLHLDNFLYLLHSYTHYYQSRGLPLAQGPWRYFYKTVRGRECYQSVRRFFNYKTVRGHTHTLSNFTAAFFISEFEDFCSLPDYWPAFFEFEGFYPIFGLPDCRGLPPWWWLLFLPENRPVSILLCTYYTLAFTSTYTTLARYSTSHVTAFDHFLPTTRIYGVHYETARWLFFQIWGLLPIFWLPDCTEATSLMMAAFFTVVNRSFSIL